MFKLIRKKIKSLNENLTLAKALQLYKAEQKNYIPLAIDDSIKKGKVLVFAPHPDDETIGCGGTIKLHVNRGDTVKVVVVTDGAKGYWEGDVDNYIEVRKEEAKNAFCQLGVDNYSFLGLEDQGFNISPATFKLFKNEILSYNPEVIYCPSLNEIHRDHLLTSCLVLTIAKSLKKNIQILEYEIGNPVSANILVDITSAIATKNSAIQCYKSQLVAQDIIGKTLGLNKYRTINVDDMKVNYIEAFRSTIFNGNNSEII